MAHLLHLQIVANSAIQINVKPADHACSIGILCLDTDGLDMVLISWAMKDPGEEGISLRPNLAKCLAGNPPMAVIRVQSQQNTSFMVSKLVHNIFLYLLITKLSEKNACP